MARSWRRTLTSVLAIALMATLGIAPMRPARAATTLTVTSTADLAAPCIASAFSLRCAITQANTDAAGDIITFHIPATAPGCAGAPAVCAIRTSRALPFLTASSTIINGYTQPGAHPNTNTLAAGDNAVLTLRLDGSGAGPGVDGFVLLGARDTIKGLSITGFQTCFAPSPGCNGIPGSQTGGDGVRINGPGDVVAGNFLGLAPDGKTAGPNQFAGVNAGPAQFARGASTASMAFSDTIGGATPDASNVLSGNGNCFGGTCEGFGVYIFAGSGSVIARNYIGTTASGSAALTNTATGVVILAPRNVLAGNVISGSGGDAVLIGASASLITGNRIGTNAAGSAAVGNHSHGIDVQFPSTSATIRSNVISANGDTGLVLETTGNVVQGNHIGTDASGTIALGNGLHPSAIFLGQPINGTDGVVVCAGPNTIGGSAPGAGNLISANAGDGISLVSSGNVVRGNTVGTNATGTAALPNRVDGIGSRSDALKGSGFCQQAPNDGGSNNTIGGATPGAGNLISGNSGDGIVVLGNGNMVMGNRIGANAAATSALGNGGDGLALVAICDGSACMSSSNNVIGGTGAGAGNVIGGNRGNGVLIDGTGGGLSNVVQGNAIGAAISGTVALGNGANGVMLENGAIDDSIGGTAPGAGNIIAHNAAAGVLVGASGADTGTHSAVRQNAIFANGGLGIDLAPQGAINCATPPPGPNDYTPCPLIQTATTTTISGMACASCTVEAYLASNEAGDQGHGEGLRLLGSATASGTGAWSLTLAPGQVSTGQRVTATATTPAAFKVPAQTSEFAANRMVGRVDAGTFAF